MASACYRKLRRYKYQLVEPYSHDVGIAGHQATTAYLQLTQEGILTLQKNYAWDGPSGPTLDTPSFMRSSLVHDGLYQLMRMSLLPTTFKEQADRLLQSISIKDGMPTWRAWYVYQAVKRFSGNAAKPGTSKPDVIYCVPKKN